MNPTGNQADIQQAAEKARAVKRAHASQLLSKANVVGVGVGFCQRDGARTDTVGLVVMVKQKLPREQLSADDILPTEIDGVPVDVQEVGVIKAQ
ncbi:MAG: hypothetical protein PVF74_12680 [Anaerolineales bacterium]|jgi:hypothetical protein